MNTSQIPFFWVYAVMCCFSSQILNKMEREKDLKTMMKWVYIFFIWTTVCLISIFWIKWEISIGLWLLITGLVKLKYKEKYRLWYNRVYGTDY